MSALAELIAGAARQGGTSLVTGTVGWASGRPTVTVEGVQVPAVWLDPVSVNYGDSVAVALSRGEVGQSSAIVLGRVTTQPRATTGTVVSTGGGSAVVKTAFGDVKATHSWSAPSVGQAVSLMWQDGRATTVGPVTYTAPDPPGPPPTPPPAQALGIGDYGTTVVRPVFSASWSTRRSDGLPWTDRIVAGGPSRSVAAWGYGGQFAPLTQIKGFRVLEARLHFGERTPDGGAVAVSLTGRCHTSAHLGGQPTGTGPAMGVALKARQPGGQDAKLSADVIAWLIKNPGGLMWTSAGEGGVDSIASDPTSGQITIRWTTLPENK